MLLVQPFTANRNRLVMHTDHNVLDLSYREWEFLSREPPVAYHLYRVSGAADPARVRITIIEDPLQAIKEGRLRLCLAV